jgi:hypothetical protein
MSGSFVTAGTKSSSEDEAMQRLEVKYAGSLLMAGVLIQCSVSQERGSQTLAQKPTDDEKVQAILASDSPYRASNGYQVLFRSIDSDGLRRLQSNASDSIAIQAAWQQVELTVPERSGKVVRPDRDKLAWFLGFLEGRARVRVPAWWAEAILDARANRRGNVYAGGLNVTADDAHSRPKATLPRKASVNMKDGKLLVQIGSQSAFIPNYLQDSLTADGPGSAVAAIITPTHCLIAAHDCIGYPYNLVCAERSTAKIVWTSKVWASWWHDVTGSHAQSVEVTVQGDRVVVFGVASVGFHAEGFRIKDGANVFRFSNSYAPLNSD